MADADKPRGFGQSLPGVLTALAAVITVVTGLVVAVLHLKPELQPREKPAARADSPQAPIAKAPDPAKATPPNVGSAAPGAARPRVVAAAAAVPDHPFPLAKVVITTADNTLVQVGGASFGVCQGKKALPLTYGQTVPFGRMQSFAVASSGGGIVAHILLLDGTSVVGSMENCDLEGRNDPGRFTTTLDKITRVDFQR